MRNATAHPNLKAVTLGPTEIDGLRRLPETERIEAIQRLGLPTISASLRRWETEQANLHDLVKRLYGGKEDFWIAASHQDRVQYSEKIKIAEDDLFQADTLVGLLKNYLAQAGLREIRDGVSSYLAQLAGRHDKSAAEIIDKFEQGARLMADALSEWKQYNCEVDMVNPVRPDGCEAVLRIDARLGGSPRGPSLYDHAANFFPLAVKPGITIEVAAPNRDVFPDAVKSALLKADAEKRAAFAASARSARAGAPEPGAWNAPIAHALPPRAPELASPDDPAPALRSGNRR